MTLSKRNLKLSALAIVVLASFAMLTQGMRSVAAAPADQVQSGVNKIGGNETGSNGSLLSIIRIIVNTLLFILGAFAVVMIVYGGFKYVVSRGESADVTSAKNTILYAVVGLIVAILAYAIVQFVVTAFKPAPLPTSFRTGDASGNVEAGG